MAGKDSNGTESDPLMQNYGSLKIRDHFTLRSRGSRIHFSDTNTVDTVWSAGNQQYIIEDDYDDDGENEKEQMKLIDISTSGYTAIRAICSLVGLFWAGFLLILSLQLLVYLVLDLLIQSGATDNKGGTYPMIIGTFLAFPLYIHGLTQIMVVAGSYVADTWNGNELLKRFVFGDGLSAGVIVDWITFSFFLWFPLMVMCGSIFMGKENWWEITVLFWFYSIATFFALYYITLVKTELQSTFEVTRNWRDILDDGEVNESADFFETLSQAIQTRNHHYFSGMIHFNYSTKGSIDSAGMDKSVKSLATDKTPYYGLWYRFVSLKIMDCLFENVGEQHKDLGYNVQDIGEVLQSPTSFGTNGIEIFDMDDVQEFRPFITRETWSLERFYCRNTKSRSVIVYEGPEAVTRRQIMSSVVCYVIGQILSIVIFAAILFWLQIPTIAIAVLTVVFMLGQTDEFRAKLNFMKEVNSTDWVNEEDQEKYEDKKSLGMYEVWRRFRVRQPKTSLCFMIFGVEVVVFFLWPLITLYTIGNHKTATVFLFMGLISIVRSYFDPAIVLEETNKIDFVDTPDESNDEGFFWSNKLLYSEKHWNKTSRLVAIVKVITRSRYTRVWRGIFGVFLLALVGLFAIATTSRGEKYLGDHRFTYLHDFEYKQQKDLPYPTCNIGKGLALGIDHHESLHLSDYVFIAALAYGDTEVTQPQLDEWFGPGIATDNFEYVEDYRKTVLDDSAVTYKLISFNRSEQGLSPMGLIAIRGTVTAWDALTDVQLWSAAAVFQVLREILPGGQIWTPILHHLVNMISWLASESINRVAFYKETTKFAKHIIEDENFDEIQVTGHSLGGGLAIITGAQANIPAIALSGPNAMIGRDTFEEPVTAEALNTMTFNVIPDRDIVPRFDDRAKLFQEIDCHAPSNELIGCHNSYRSLCEIIYTCGTMGRPAICECAEMGYEPPEPKDGVTMTFKEACKAARAPTAEG